MVDAIDSLLNNAVDLYVQAVNYRRISTSQILTRSMPESGDVWQMSPDSGYLASPTEILPEWQDPGQLAGLWPGRLASGQLAEIRH